MELSKTGSMLANDAVTVSGTLTYGARLMVTKVGAGVLAANDTFKLFNGSAFASLFSSLPALTGNLVWNTHLLSISRTIAVAIGVNTTPTNIVAVVSGNNLPLAEPADHIDWCLWMQTNTIAAGVSGNTNDWATLRLGHHQ